MPVQIDDARLAGSGLFRTRRPMLPVLPTAMACPQYGPFSVEIDADLHEHLNGSLIEIGIDIGTPVEPSRGTLLFLTGHSPAHFETVKLLSSQADLPLFIGDEFCNVLTRQRIILSDAMRTGFKQLLDEALGRDAVIRMTGHYDADKVFNDVLATLSL